MLKNVVRTKMAEAFCVACSPDALRGRKLSRTARVVVHRVLTNTARGVGVKFDPSKRKIKAESAVVMKEAA